MADAACSNRADGKIIIGHPRCCINSLHLIAEFYHTIAQNDGQYEWMVLDNRSGCWNANIRKMNEATRPMLISFLPKGFGKSATRRTCK